ncbi:MAG: GspE/PulE family protein [Alphaproteobacteria bacterium]|nr:GspE/PulE family protein [Alphaproteobacteria bacterium]
MSNKVLPLRPVEKETLPRLGERLLGAGYVSSDQIKIALHEQRQSKEPLGAVLVRLGFLHDAILAEALASHTGHQTINLKTASPDPQTLKRVPHTVAARCHVVPLFFDGTTLKLAVADPLDIGSLDEIRRYFPRQIDIVQLIASQSDIVEFLDAQVWASGTFDAILQELEGVPPASVKENDAWQHPIVRLVNAIVSDAVREGASDIHLEPEESFVRLRVRVDGVLKQKHALHSAHWPPLSHRLKLMAGMNIADTRSMQDGRFHMHLNGADIDFRMAVMPTVHGENIVIRILDHRRALLPLDKLGYSAHVLHQLDLLLERPEGVVLVTGPTGSGKTTSLYAMLKRLSHIGVNIMTLEEPVEYAFDLIRQTSIQEQLGLGFAEGVRGLLRQAPDIVFIGEIRDDATARMALRAAMTGHKVFSTLHCNDAFGAFARLSDLGLSARMMAENIGGVVAQRLVRKLCPLCKRIRPATPEERRFIERTSPAPMAVAGFAEAQQPLTDAPLLAESVGCPACGHTGYRGRSAVTEILRVTQGLDEQIAAEAPRSALHRRAEEDGFVSMADDGLAKVLGHETSLDELRRNVDLTRLC